jgi:hypothetical protein
MDEPTPEVSDSMLTETSTPAPNEHDGPEPSRSPAARLIGRITRVEIVVGAVIAAMMLVLVLIEPGILEAPFQNRRTLLFTFGGTALAAAAFVGMLWFRVPPVVRVVVLVVPFVIVNWWLLSPYFIDDVVDESFSTSIAEQVVAVDEAPVPAAAEQQTAPGPTASAAPAPAAAVPTTVPAGDDAPVPATAAPEAAAAESGPTVAGDVAPAASTPAPEPTVAAPAPAEAPAATTPPPPTGPVLRGAGQFVGLAGHSGTGDAGIFQNPDGSLVLRFENFDIENGPDLEVYLVPGADQTSLADGSIHLGALKGNVGDQNYELAGTDLAPGTYTALVWCEAFSVEFVGATITI